MRTRNILAALLLLVAGLQTASAQKIILHMPDNQKVEYEISQLDSITFEESDDIIVDEHEWVDLGLPSGTLWAKCNVGANSPEEYGDYFAWGETTGFPGDKEVFDWNTYKYCNYNDNASVATMTKYCTRRDYGLVDNKTELDSEDDAATANWGSGWQMPSIAQYNELMNSNYTDIEWTNQGGSYGRKITSKSNGKSVFLPAAGYRLSGGFGRPGLDGYYWSRSLHTDYDDCAYQLTFYFGNIYTKNAIRCYGLSVRPVRKQ